MTYIIDLHKLWEEHTDNNVGARGGDVSIDPRQNIVSVVVVATANETLLIQTLKSVLAQRFVREIIIVNCEPAQSSSFLAKYIKLHPKCYVVSGHPKIGLAAAYNLGAQHASGQFLLFMTDACLLPKNAVMKLLSTGIRKTTPCVVGVEDKTYCKEKAQVSWGAAIKGWLKTKSEKVFEANKLPEVSLPGGGVHATHVAPYCLFLNTKTFLGLKGMDKNCFHSTFHVDLCLRVHLAGGDVYWAKELDVVLQPSPRQSLRHFSNREWCALRGWYHYYKKYVSKYTNKSLMGVLYIVLMMHFLWKMSTHSLARLWPRTSKMLVVTKPHIRVI